MVFRHPHLLDHEAPVLGNRERTKEKKKEPPKFVIGRPPSSFPATLDPYPYHLRPIGPPIAGDPPPPPPPHHHNSFWYPPSSPPPPPPPGGYHHHQQEQNPDLSPAPNQQTYSHYHPSPYLPPPQQQWDHASDPNPYHRHDQQQQQHPPPPPAPAYHSHQSVPPYPGAEPSSYRYGLPPRPQQQQQQPAYPPPPPAYPTPTQIVRNWIEVPANLKINSHDLLLRRGLENPGIMKKKVGLGLAEGHREREEEDERKLEGWGSSSWAQHEGWEYPERRIPYNNEEDWAARAMAWASSKSVTDSHYTQSQFMSAGRADDHTYPYRDHYQQQSAGPPQDSQLPSFTHFSYQRLPEQLQKQDSSHQLAPFSSGSPYHTDVLPYYRAGGEAMASNASHMASPQKAYGSSSSVYEQEVPYSYYSAPGNREAVGSSECLHAPPSLSVPPVPEILNSHPTYPARNISMEQPHFTLVRQSTEPLADASDLPLEFEPRSVSGKEPHQKITYGNADPSGYAGAMDHDRVAMPVHAWNPGVASGVAFSQISQIPSGTQFDTSFASQPPLSLHSVPNFGVTGPNFGTTLPPVSIPFGTGAGTHTFPFAGDSTGPFGLSERPKKAAVPNWLREEIIKQKSVMTSAVPTEHTGNTFHFNGHENADKVLRTANQVDVKSIDSTKSTEDDEDDEDDLEMARSAAINQEIKRVLTEVLLKVTDELFDEIATKVLNEDDISVEINDNAANGTRKVSPPPAVPTPKASARVLVQVKKNNSKGEGVSQNSSPSSPGGNILGLASYASDEDEDETESSNIMSSGKVVDASRQLEAICSPKEALMEAGKVNAVSNSKEPSRGPHDMESEARMDVGKSVPKSASGNKEGSYITGNVSQPAGKTEVSKFRDELTSTNGGKLNEIYTQSTNPLKLKDARGESINGSANSGKSAIVYGSSTSSKNTIVSSGKLEIRSNSNDLVNEGKASPDKASHKTSNVDNLHEGKTGPKKREDKKDNSNDKFDNKGGRRAANERDLDTKNSSKHDIVKDDRKEILNDKREKYKEGDGRKREQTRDRKEDRSTRVTKDSSRHSSRRSSSSSSRGRKSKEYPSRDRGSASSDEPSENSKKRKLQPNRNSLAPSPTRTKKRQVSRSPHSKHSHRGHSPYSSLEKRRRSRSRTPINRRSVHKHDK